MESNCSEMGFQRLFAVTPRGDLGYLSLGTYKSRYVLAKLEYIKQPLDPVVGIITRAADRSTSTGSSPLFMLHDMNSQKYSDSNSINSFI